jgi:CRP/FNR family transcriptional regulator, dissimilatory nitrate respiration regulator
MLFNKNMSEAHKIGQILREKAVFKPCESAYLDELTKKSRLVNLSKGQVLFLNKDKASNFYIVLKGWVKLYRETMDGIQVVVDIMPTGHMFGETSIFEEDVYPYSAEAVEPSTVIELPIKMLKTEIESNSKFALKMMGAMVRYRKQQDQELEHRTIQNASQRIGCFLLRIAQMEEQGSLTVCLPYDKTLVASKLGMQPETFSRALTKLKEATGIEVKGNSVQIESIDKLAGYSCEACSWDFPCKDIQKKSC